jgi:AraC-like DNA-binding protein
MYLEHAPSAALAGAVECFWTMRPADALPGEVQSRVLPDGCMDVIFDLGDARSTGGGPARPRSYVVGAMRTPVTVRHSGRIDMLGVRFRPGGAWAFTRTPAGELTDRTLGLGEVWGRRAGEMEERLMEAEPRRRIALLEAALLAAAGGSAGRDARVAHASAMIERTAGSVSVDALPRELGLTCRHLERIFAQHVGLTPKVACRVARVRGAMDRIRRQPSVSASRLALALGWYDQPHMIRDFRQIAGTTPAAFARDVAIVQDGAGPAD